MGIKPFQFEDTGYSVQNSVQLPKKKSDITKAAAATSSKPPVEKKKTATTNSNNDVVATKNTDGTFTLDFSKMVGNDSIKLTSSYDDTPSTQPKKKKKSSSSNQQVAAVNFDVDDNNSSRPLNIIESNEPIENKYIETNNILRSAIAEIDRTLVDLQHDISEVRASKTMRGKYTYLSNMQSGVAGLIGNKIAAARELNSTIGKCNDFELKRYKEIQAVNAAAGDEDANVMKMYQAFMQTPVSGNGGGLPNVSLSAIDSSLAAPNQFNLGNIQTAGFDNYMNNLSPQQNMMRLENDPNIKEVVVYNQETGARYFDIVDMRTGQHVPNTEPMDPMFLEDVTIDLKNKIARNINLGESYPLIIVGQPIMTEY